MRVAGTGATGLPVSVVSLNRLLEERGQLRGHPLVALATSYFLHAIVIALAVLYARKQPYIEYRNRTPGLPIMSIRQVLGTPDGIPGGPPFVVPPSRRAPEPANQDDPVVAKKAPEKVAPPPARDDPEPQHPATHRELKPRSTPTAQTARPRPRDTSADSRSRSPEAGDRSAPVDAAGTGAAGGDANGDVLTRRGGRGSPTGILGGSEQGGLGELVFGNQWYVTQVRDIVYMNWANPFQGRQPPSVALRVIVDFRIQRDGSVGDIHLEQSSGNDNYDRAGMRAVQHARLPPLPRDYSGREVRVSFEFASNAD